MEAAKVVARIQNEVAVRDRREAEKVATRVRHLEEIQVRWEVGSTGFREGREGQSGGPSHQERKVGICATKCR